MNLLPFAVMIPPKDRDRKLTKKLEAEWSGILAWAIAGCLRWQHDGLSPPPAVIDATEDYLAGEDMVGAFIEEECKVGVNFSESSSALFTDWKTWAENNNAFVGGFKDLWRLARRSWLQAR